MTPEHSHDRRSSPLAHAFLAASLFVSGSFRNTIAATPPGPSINKGATVDPVFPHESRDLGPYLSPLRPSVVPPGLAANLIAAKRMTNAAEGIVFDEKHIIFVSWDLRGSLLPKAAFNLPSASHTAAFVMRSQIEAHTDSSDSVSHILSQRASVISFLPDSSEGITTSVRIFPAAFEDPRGVPGRNWQSLDFLFSPNSYFRGAPIHVSATLPIRVNDSFYRAFVHRAHDLDAANTRYFVLGSRQRVSGVENCIGALQGVAHYLPQPVNEPITRKTFTLRGEAATTFVAHELLRKGGISGHGRDFFHRDDDAFLLQAFLRSSNVTPDAWQPLKTRP